MRRDRFPDGDSTRDQKRELGVELLANLETESLPLPEAIDRIETITTSPSLTRDILDTARKRGIIDREDGRIRTQHGGASISLDGGVTTREGDFECRRCGTSISTGHFIEFETGDLGPFGSSCVKMVLGRDG